MARFGVEEEFVLVDRQSLAPLITSPHSHDGILGEAAGGCISREYLTCQLETATSPVSALSEARQQLQGMRSLLSDHAASLGGIAASTGTPFLSPDHVELAPVEHYTVVAELLGEVTREHQVNGLHIHVEVPDDEERVRVLDRIRGWMPVLLALTGNAPFTHGRDTGFASWRSILIRRLSTCWTPPHFEDATDYRTRVDRFVETGLISEASSLGWTVRLSERFPTVEVRVCDAQLTIDETLLAVALTRALVETDDLGSARDVGLDAIDASLWTAARRGQDARIIDPSDGEVVAVRDVIAKMLDRLRPVLAQHGDDELVADVVARIRSDGTGAQRQLRTYAARGADGLAELYRSTTARV